MAKSKKETPGLNGAGMSDISFLLLCFFLMTSSMDQSKGLQRRLPPMPTEDQKPADIKTKKHNLMAVLVDGKNRLSVNQRLMDISQLRTEVKDFILNPTNNPDKSSKVSTPIAGIGNVDVSEALISLQNVRSTSYDMYLRVQNELVAAYNELRDEESVRRFSGKKFSELTESQQDAIKKIFPQRISEAEPKDFNKKK